MVDGTRVALPTAVLPHCEVSAMSTTAKYENVRTHHQENITSQFYSRAAPTAGRCSSNAERITKDMETMVTKRGIRSWTLPDADAHKLSRHGARRIYHTVHTDAQTPHNLHLPPNYTAPNIHNNAPVAQQGAIPERHGTCCGRGATTTKFAQQLPNLHKVQLRLQQTTSTQQSPVHNSCSWISRRNRHAPRRLC